MVPLSSAADLQPGKEALQRALVETLLESARLSLPAGRVELIETHISYLILAGPHAYKIKKALDLGFLDFSTLERRGFYCQEEVRLNRRLAPELYLGVVPISGPPARPVLEGEGDAIEYAVKMLRFPQDALLDCRLAAGDVIPAQIEMLADRVAAFHEQAARAGGDYGTPAAVWAPMEQNFIQLAAAPLDAEQRRILAGVEAWSREQYSRLGRLLLARQRGGFIRECHGDLHLGNIALVDGEPRIFDCLEFNPQLRWIDTISDVAFLAMDLEERGRPNYARLFLNRYLEDGGDYGALQVYPLYRVYRAVVRAKVAAIRAARERSPSRVEDLETCRRYLAFAARAMSAPSPRILVLHGLSGSGKTWLAQALVENTGAIRLRSDVERKRLHGLPARGGASPVDGGIYAAAATLATYRRLADLAGMLLAAGFSVVIDAATLKSWQRELFRHLAQELRVPLRLVACQASDETLRRRLLQRAQAGKDASDADLEVLEHQRRHMDPLTPYELATSLRVDSEADLPGEILERLQEWRD